MPGLAPSRADAAKSPLGGRLVEIAALVLAAGEGTRMKSSLPKVLHPLLDRPILAYVLDCLRQARIERSLVVIGHGSEQVESYLAGSEVKTVLQDERLGTGHAVMSAADAFSDFSGKLLVISGDTPLLRVSTVDALLHAHEQEDAAVTILTSVPPDPEGYGRIVRDGQGRVVGIVEQKDATPEELRICETNSSIYCFAADQLFSALTRLDRDNVQGEYYLTDVIKVLAGDGGTVASCTVDDYSETMGINSRQHVAEALAVLQRRINERWMAEGVTITAPEQTWIGVDVELGRDVTLSPQTQLLGKTAVGAGSKIGPGVRLVDSSIGKDVTIEQAVIRECIIEDGVNVGPYCSLRPGTVLRAGSKAGTFVEMKKTEVGQGSKVPHLSYMGDATIGRDANIGAGTITCNYDGKNKYPTVIEDGAFLGSDTMLIAPVRIGEGGVTGAGSAISKDVPADGLAIERGNQKTIQGWAKRKRGKGDRQRKE